MSLSGWNLKTSLWDLLESTFTYQHRTYAQAIKKVIAKLVASYAYIGDGDADVLYWEDYSTHQGAIHMYLLCQYEVEEHQSLADGYFCFLDFFLCDVSVVYWT